MYRYIDSIQQESKQKVMFLYSFCLQHNRGKRINMAHYRRKPYKRKHIDDIFEKDPVEKFVEESYLDLYVDTESDSLFTMDEPFLAGEPDIVRQLRFEELQGSLSTKQNIHDTMNIDLTVTKTPNERQQPQERIVKDYNDALALAKKALQEVQKNEK